MTKPTLTRDELYQLYLQAAARFERALRVRTEAAKALDAAQAELDTADYASDECFNAWNQAK